MGADLISAPTISIDRFTVGRREADKLFFFSLRSYVFLQDILEFPTFSTSHKALFGCCRIYFNPCVLVWIDVEFSSSSTSIHLNTCGLM